MINSGESVLVGLSGGADSVSLLCVLDELKNELNINKIYAAHLHHGLRETADRDVEFCRILCESLNIEFFTKKENIKEMAKSYSTGEEDAGRIARYGFFKELTQKFNIDKVATAHNMNDQAETFLMRVISGSTLDGLSCIKPCREDGIIRPLIGSKRTEIEAYLESKGQGYVTDETNLEDIYKRNSIRHNLIPYIEKNYNPNYIETAAMMAEDFLRDCRFVESEVRSALSRISLPADIDELNKLDDSMLVRVVSSLCDTTFSKNAKISLLEYIRKGKTGTSFPVNKKFFLYTEYKKLFLREYMSSEDYIYKLNIGENYVKEIDATFIVSEGAGSGKDTVNISSLDNLFVRNRRAGDRIYIKGINGNKKLKNIFTDRKIPKADRDIWPVIEENGKIIWLTGIYKNENDNIKYNIKVKWRQTNV